jgi:leader peptidase (prepilin peptidase)/N-methyltransferase
MIFLFLVLAGLIVGSFLGALIWRIKVGESVARGRSYCPLCKHQLGFWDLIPLFSFLGQRGRCRYCRRPISLMYPFLELASAGILILLFLYFGLSLEFFIYSAYSFFLITIFVYDLRWQIIPDEVVIPGIVIALIGQFFLPVKFTEALLGAIIGGGFFLIQYLVSRGRWIGGGDIRLGVMMGLMLGWPRLLAALFLAYFLGAVIGIILIAFGRKKMKSYLAFGPFLTLFTLVALIYGDFLIEWYLNLLNF